MVGCKHVRPDGSVVRHGTTVHGSKTTDTPLLHDIDSGSFNRLYALYLRRVQAAVPGL